MLSNKTDQLPTETCSPLAVVVVLNLYLNLNPYSNGAWNSEERQYILAFPSKAKTHLTSPDPTFHQVGWLDCWSVGRSLVRWSACWMVKFLDVDRQLGWLFVVHASLVFVCLAGLLVMTIRLFDRLSVWLTKWLISLTFGCWTDRMSGLIDCQLAMCSLNYLQNEEQNIITTVW